MVVRTLGYYYADAPEAVRKAGAARKRGNHEDIR